MSGEWIPIIFFISLATVVISFLALNHKHKQKLQDTLQLAIEKGQQLSPETVDSLLSKNRPFEELKKGVILITLGVAIATVLMLIPNADASEGIAISAFPIVLGLGYLVIWKLRPKFDV